MQIIIRKAIIVHSPAPPFVGTRLTVKATPDCREFVIMSGNVARESESIRVEWGDGRVDTVTDVISALAHVYEADGEYVISISDDVNLLGVINGSAGTGNAKMLTHVFSNAQKLTNFRPSCFAGATNLEDFDLVDTLVSTFGSKLFYGCTSLRSTGDKWPKRLTTLGVQTFAECTGLEVITLPVTCRSLSTSDFSNCTGLKGRIDLPGIAMINSTTAANAPFCGCTGITEVHFSAANEAQIRASGGFIAAPNLGAENATIFFDL